MANIKEGVMVYQDKQNQPSVVDKVVELLYEKQPKEEATLIENFIRQYFGSTSPQDLEKIGVIDLYGAMICHWRFLNHRAVGETKVHVYNPQFEQYGWQSTHTVIEIIQDDMPFLLDSVRMELNRRGLTAHMILHLGNLHIERNSSGEITQIFDKNKESSQSTAEAPLFFEIDKQSDANTLIEIKDSIESVLQDVKDSVSDWGNMCDKMNHIIEELPSYSNGDEIGEQIAFLKWLCENNFTFLGYCQLSLGDLPDVQSWELLQGTTLGLFNKGVGGFFDNYQNLPKEAKALVTSREKLIIGKASRLSTVHRPAYPDLIAIKCFDEAGNVSGAHCFIGLYTAAAYNRSTLNIPLLRHKVQNILDKAAFDKASHDGKTLINILETIAPKDVAQWAHHHAPRNPRCFRTAQFRPAAPSPQALPLRPCVP